MVDSIKKELEYKEIIEQLLAIKLNGFKTLKEFEDAVLKTKEGKKKTITLSNLNSFKERITKRKTTYKYANEENFK